jgi:photosystem II stability/assembly factor-like uncharacterized protein
MIFIGNNGSTSAKNCTLIHQNILMKKLFLLIALAPALLSAQPATWHSRGIGGGGALFSPSISPLDASNIYLQCDMSEVFHTTNKGTSWNILDFRELISTGGMHTVEFTSDPGILYTVNMDFITDERFPVKSTDGGAHWAPTLSDPTGSDAWYISADPQSTNRLLLVSYDELFFSDNGGTSFQSVYSANDLHIAGVFWDGTSIYVGTREGLLVSTDNGASFAPDNTSGIPSGNGFISFTGSKNGATVRLMGTIADQSDLYPGVNALDIGICTGILRMDYGTTSWQSAVSGIDTDHEIFLISSARTDVNTFYVGGTNTNNSFPVVYKTTNGGGSWSEVFLTANNQNIITGWSGYQGDENWWFGEIVFGLDVAPNDPNTVIITDYGYAHVTSDGGTTWNQAYVETADQNPAGSPTPVDQSYAGNGLENTASWSLHWSDANTVFASYTDITGIRSTDGGLKWAVDYSGIDYNTVYRVIEHPDGTLYAAVSSVHDIYQSTYLTDNSLNNGDGAILYSTDNGVTWQMLHDFSMPVIWLALNPNNTNELYASVVNSTNGGIFKTTNLNAGASSSWSLTAAPPRTEGHPYNIHVLNDGTVISSWCARRTTNFTASSGVFMSVNGGTSWQDVSLDDEMHYWTKDLIVDPHDNTQNTWYTCVFSGWGGAANDKGGLYKTTNRGTSWTLVFDSYRVESAAINPQNANEMYMTTESDGLWYTNDLNAVTPTFEQLDAFYFQHPVRVFFNPYDNDEIWVTSFGNGLRMGTTGATNNIAESAMKHVLDVYPNPAEGQVTVVSESGPGKWILVDQLGKTVLEGTSEAEQATISVLHLEPGSYLLKATDAHGRTGTAKVIILH